MPSLENTKMDESNIMKPPTTIDPRDENTPDAFVLRDPSMVRLTGKHPFNAGTYTSYYFRMFAYNSIRVIRGPVKVIRESRLCHT